jgi:hypothetical protein
MVQIHGMGEERRFKLNNSSSSSSSDGGGVGSNKSEVVWVDTLSRVLGVKPYEDVALDTTALIDRTSREQVYQFVTFHGTIEPGRTGDKVSQTVSQLPSRAPLSKTGCLISLN